MPLTAAEKDWYFSQISKLDPTFDVVQGDATANVVHYSALIRTDKSSTRNADPEELVHALAMVMLHKSLAYPLTAFYHEKHIAHGSLGSQSDELDLLIEDDDHLPFALWEFKSSEEYAAKREKATQFQLFGTAPLLTQGAPRYLVCATIDPVGEDPHLKLRCIDYSLVKDYTAWIGQGSPSQSEFSREYRELGYKPYIRGGEKDLRENCTLAEFHAVATQFHNEFFAEHPDNQLFETLVKILLAKISSEKNTPIGKEYAFQITYKNGKAQSALSVFEKINTLYGVAYTRYIDPTAKDEIDTRIFAPERVKSVVAALEGMALTRGSALSTDIMGAFFEVILRSGFKQDRGMYFTHDNIARFMVEAVDIPGLAKKKWQDATHPNNRLPYVMDPACGSGTFLLHSMQSISTAIRNNQHKLVQTDDEIAFFKQNLSDAAPNAWAKDFLYGFDHKFIMALTAKVNMVLHGDGVTHIFKDDAFRPLQEYTDEKFRPLNSDLRTLSLAKYSNPVCESFDVVISNPPFGTTLSPQTNSQLPNTFSLGTAHSTEALFIERAFQLLKSRGRLAVVLPESILNASDNIEVRKLIFRLFKLKAVVLLPRNIFFDTPTLTSLLFAKKKTREEVATWDAAWDAAVLQVDAKVQAARSFTTTKYLRTDPSAATVETQVQKALTGLVTPDSWVVKSGAKSRVLGFKLPSTIISGAQAASHYKDLLWGAGFDALVDQYVFSKTAQFVNYEWATYTVSEVGFKLSKRKERARENQLCNLIGMHSGKSIQNLHLADEPVTVEIDKINPTRVLDFIAADVNWEN